MSTDQSRPAAHIGNESRSAWNTAKTITWAFFGVGRRHAHDAQADKRISPVHVVIAGFVGVFVLVAGLIVLVNWVVA